MRMKPIIQLSIDTSDISRALKIVEDTVNHGVEWVEIGSPLIKNHGLNTSGVDQKEMTSVVDGTRRVLKNRIDPEGIREIEMRSHGNRIFIQIPDVDNIDKIRSRIDQIALLEFCLVNEDLADNKKARSGEEVPGYRLAKYMESEAGEQREEGLWC